MFVIGTLASIASQVCCSTWALQQLLFLKPLCNFPNQKVASTGLTLNAGLCFLMGDGDVEFLMLHCVQTRGIAAAVPM